MAPLAAAPWPLSRSAGKPRSMCAAACPRPSSRPCRPEVDCVNARRGRYAPCRNRRGRPWEPSRRARGEVTTNRSHFSAGRLLLALVVLFLVAGHVAIINAITGMALTVTAAATIVAIVVLKYALWRRCRRRFTRAPASTHRDPRGLQIDADGLWANPRALLNARERPSGTAECEDLLSCRVSQDAAHHDRTH